MKRNSFSRSVKLTTASLMAVLFGFPALVLANRASIDTTGPDSYNKIEFENKYECDVENNNDVNVHNKNFQSASTGDAVVGSGWGAYAPEAWQAKGYSYDEWRSAVDSYMNKHEGEWRGKWGHGGGNTIGGDATSGDATNVNDTRTNVSIDNSGACAEYILVDVDGDGKPDKKVLKKPGHVLGEDKHKGKAGVLGAGHGIGGGEGFGAAGFGVGGGYGQGVGGQGGVGGAKYPHISGGAGEGKDKGKYDGNEYSISKTGPDSYNKISDVNKSSVNVENNNNVYVKNFSAQSASTGDATVAGNTKAGSSGSGNSSNANGTDTGAGISN